MTDVFTCNLVSGNDRVEGRLVVKLDDRRSVEVIATGDGLVINAVVDNLIGASEAQSWGDVWAMLARTDNP